MTQAWAQLLAGHELQCRCFLILIIFARTNLMGNPQTYHAKHQVFLLHEILCGPRTCPDKYYNSIYYTGTLHYELQGNSRF